MPFSSSATAPGAPAPALPAPLPVVSSDGLSPAARRGAVLGVVAAHLAGGWALLQIESVRQAVAEVAPLMVEMIAPPSPEPPALPPPPPPPPSKPRPKPVLPTPIVSAAPSPVPAVFEVAPAPPEPPEPTPVVVIEPAPPAPPAPSPPPAPKTIAITAVEYLTPPRLVYPTTSKRFGEAGRVHVRVLVGPDGAPRQMQLEQSSGHERLDDSALATVRATRFKPYTENGVAQAFWVVMPLVFELKD